MIITCPHCNKEVEVKSEHAGKNVECPWCQMPFPVPSSQPNSSPSIFINATGMSALPQKMNIVDRTVDCAARTVTTVVLLLVFVGAVIMAAAYLLGRPETYFEGPGAGPFNHIIAVGRGIAALLVAILMVLCSFWLKKYWNKSN